MTSGTAVRNTHRQVGFLTANLALCKLKSQRTQISRRWLHDVRVTFDWRHANVGRDLRLGSWGDQVGQRILRVYRVLGLPRRSFLSQELNAACAISKGQSAIPRRPQPSYGAHSIPELVNQLCMPLTRTSKKNSERSLLNPLLRVRVQRPYILDLGSAGQAKCHIYHTCRHFN